MGFLKEYWLWIVVPFVLVIGAILVFMLMTESDPVSPFQYNVF
jgi:hypothetical protein